MSQSSALRRAINAAACLCGQRDETLPLSTGSGGDRVKARLESRLRAYYASRGGAVELTVEDDLESQTGTMALDAVDAIHKALSDQLGSISSQSSSAILPGLGSRDLKIVQIVLAIVSNWKLAILIDAFDASLNALQSATISRDAPSKLVELPDEASLAARRQKETHRFSATCSDASGALDQLWQLLGLNGSQSQVSDSVLHSCGPHVVSLAIRIAFGPMIRKDDENRQSQGEKARTMITELLRSLSTSSCLKILSASGHVGRSTRRKSTTPNFVKVATERLYSAQLLRTDAVMALFRHVLGNDEEHGSDLMKKLAGVGHLLSTPPPKMSLGIYVSIILPRLMDIVSHLPTHSIQDQQKSPSKISTSTHKTAACFALARLHDVAPEAVKRCAHDMIWKHLLPEPDHDLNPENAQVRTTVQLLYRLVEFSEPSTTFLSFLITPVVVPLLTLCSFLQSNIGKTIVDMDHKGKSTEDALSSMAASLLKTWLRLADIHESCTVLSPKSRSGIFSTTGSSVMSVRDSAEDESRAYWTRKDEEITFSWSTSQKGTDLATALSGLQMQDLHMMLTSSEEADATSSLMLSALQLSPSPSLLSSLLKESSRKDIASQLLSDLLECYTLAKQAGGDVSDSSDSSTETVIYVQHILELVSVFGSDIISGQADKILSFINFALGTGTGLPKEDQVLDDTGVPLLRSNGHPQGPLAGLTNIGRDVEETGKSSVPMDEEPDDELVETALNLLLSLLEGSPDISMRSHSLLRIISAKLGWHVSNPTNSEIRTLSKEAKMVITARELRTASSVNVSIPDTPLQKAFAEGNETYQEALRLLQDPILPVRAHGLVLLKELAACGSTDTSQQRLMNPALTSAIVDIYIQAIQDDESFLYLNAVKGIAELANTGGKSMIRRLVELYLGSTFAKEQVDLQLRMGEALLQVIQKLEEALSANVDEIVHPLLTALRQANRPTTLRSSYLSILGTCVEACPAAFSATSIGSALIDAMLDLLSVETTSGRNQSQQEDMQDPTKLDAKLPQLRRAAVLLLALFIRGSRHQLEHAQEQQDDLLSEQEGSLTSLRMPNGSVLNGSGSSNTKRNIINAKPSLMFAEDKTERTKTILTYVAQTDSDGLTRHQSQELLEELNLLTLSRIA